MRNGKHLNLLKPSASEPMPTMPRPPKSRSRAIPRPHLDPWLVAFLVFAVIYAIARLAAAQESVAPSPAPASAGGTIFGIPITDLINLGVPACTTVYLIVKGIPGLVERFAAEQTAQRAHDQKTADELRAAIQKLDERLDRVLDRGTGGVRGDPP